MDDPLIDPSAHRQALAGLTRINRLSGSATILWPELLKLAKQSKSPLRVLDVATGAGDIPIALARRAKQSGYVVQFAGCDISTTALTHASRSAERAGVTVEFFPHDSLRQPLPQGFDVVMCSLFLHHLNESDAVKLLAAMSASAQRLVLINDLQRGIINYVLVWIATRLLSRSPIVHEDGPLSVRAAFTVPEVQALAEKAGLWEAQIERRFPCRWLLRWSRG
jgi:2-polyprenyl-3-methyl-5-hydroxy-6-metoxy-1,4-benzoquinol methylase